MASWGPAAVEERKQRMRNLRTTLIAAIIAVTTVLFLSFQKNRPSSNNKPKILGEARRESRTDHTNNRSKHPTDADILLNAIREGSSEKKIDDDGFKHDEVCKRYLMKFLNGSTDARDECAGMLNAYDAADCTEEISNSRRLSAGNSGNFLFDLVVGHHHRKDNGTDDAGIDDFYEAWQCCSSIHEYYTEHCHESIFASYTLFGIVLVLILCGAARSLLRIYDVRWIPDAAVCIVVGAIAGAVLTIAIPDYDVENMSFDNNLFLHIMLPPIIFEASLSIDKKAFRRDLFPILWFAVAGTILSAAITGLTVYGMTSATSMTTIPVLDSLLFGSLISSIDPVATLGILGAMGVSNTETLYVIIFGESLLNDGVAIVLFDTLVSHLGDAVVIDKATIWSAVLHFLSITFSSIGIGLLSGILCTFFYWRHRGHHSAVVEVGLFFCWALLPYYLSDGIEKSGIISIMTAGFWMDIFVVGRPTLEEDPLAPVSGEDRNENDGGKCSKLRNIFAKLGSIFSGQGHLSDESRHHVKFVAEVISSLMETSIFAYLGLFLFSEKNRWHLGLNGTAIFACVVSRVFMVVFMSLVINIFVCLDCEMRLSRLLSMCFSSDPTNDDRSKDWSSVTRPKPYVKKSTQLILILSGVRGAVSFALVENIPVFNAVTNEGSAFKGQLKAMTSSCIVFTVFVFGASTYWVLQRQNGGRPRRGHDENDLNAPLLRDGTVSVGGVSLENIMRNQSLADASSSTRRLHSAPREWDSI